MQRVIPDLIRNLPEASNAIFGKILNRVQDVDGELNKTGAGWVNPSDFEPSFPDSLR